MNATPFPFDTLGPIHGFRMWAVAGEILTGITRPTEWPALEPCAAECHAAKRRRRNGPPPHGLCGCGLYAARDNDLLRGAPWMYRSLLAEELPTGAIVVGPVRLWGRVYEHERGWRAEYGYPIALYETWSDDRPPLEIERLLRRYAIPTLPVPHDLFMPRRRPCRPNALLRLLRIEKQDSPTARASSPVGR